MGDKRTSSVTGWVTLGWDEGQAVTWLQAWELQLVVEIQLCHESVAFGKVAAHLARTPASQGSCESREARCEYLT